MTKLTQASLKAKLKKPGRYGDGGGLFFRVIDKTKAYWVYRYRAMIDGASKEREMSLGPYPELMLAEAREKHAKLRAKVKADHSDPLAEKRAARTAVIASKTATPTFGQIADEYLATHEGSWKNSKHVWQWKWTLNVACAPIRDMPVDQVNVEAVLGVLKPIWVKTPETASRSRGRIEAVLAAAQALGHIHADKANPARWRGHLDKLLSNPKKTGKPRCNHPAMPYADLPAFMAKLKATPAEAAKALQFVILTGARSGEVFGATWDEMALDRPANGAAAQWGGPTWTVPARRMKMGRQHPVPLSDAAVAIVGDQLAHRGPKQAYVFESPVAQGGKIHRSGAHQPLSNMALAMLMRRLGVGCFTVHGFRSAFRSWCADTGVPFEVAEACLAHAPGNSVVQAYMRSNMLERRRPVMSSWASFVTGESEAAKVAPISAAKRRKR
jgi:integrase